MTQLLAQQVRDALVSSNCRIVLAESCTAGSVAAALAVVPGISAWLCGSFVVYRNESKAQWLGMPRVLLNHPAIGPVSAQVTRLLAASALDATSEADIAVAVTGHIGPGSPAELDGQVFVCMKRRAGSELHEANIRLTSPPPQDAQDIVRRSARLQEATAWVLEFIVENVELRRL